MAEQQRSVGDAKSLEMRVAELEDRLAKLHVTEEEMKAYEKVSALMGSASATGANEMAAGALCQTVCQTVCQISRQRLVCITPRGIGPRQIVRFCYECNCGPCAEGGGFSGGGGAGFGGFGG